MPETRLLMVPSWQIVPRDQLSPHDTLLVCQTALRLWRMQRFDLLLLAGGVLRREFGGRVLDRGFDLEIAFWTRAQVGALSRSPA